ncbi:glycosyltransferase [Streptomyces sp. NPDC005485]|uniref:glycosyltransferase family 2 protein n=1 Tax=Streptomyces sp. NPDC005485 TaxID=3155591 RepID=UPI0033A12528
MPLISIVTPVQNEGQDYLLEAYESLHSQAMPSGWDGEWIVQEDGRTGFLASVLPADDQISTGTGRNGGAAMTRSMAMARVRGELVRALDADDLLPPGALASAINTLTQNRDAAWCVSACLDLDEILLPRLEAIRSLGWRWSPSQGMTATGEPS